MLGFDNTKPFNKEDLRTGMKVVVVNGEEYLVFLGVTQMYSPVKDMLVDPSDPNWSSLQNFDATIVKVLVPRHPYSITGYYDDWVVVYEKETLTPEQVKINELEETINKAQQQIKELKDGSGE